MIEKETRDQQIIVEDIALLKEGTRANMANQPTPITIFMDDDDYTEECIDETPSCSSSSGSEDMEEVTENLRATKLEASTYNMAAPVAIKIDDRSKDNLVLRDDSSSLSSSSVAADLYSDGGSSFGSSTVGSYSSDSTRSSTFSIYCLQQEDDDCSAISSTSAFLREEENEDVYYDGLDNSLPDSHLSSNDEDSSSEETFQSSSWSVRSIVKDDDKELEGEEEIIEEVYDEDENDSSDESDYSESYDEDINDDEYPLTYDDEYGNDQEEEEIDAVEVVPVSPMTRASFRSYLPNSDMVFEKKPKVTFSNANTRTSHSNQVAQFLTSVSEARLEIDYKDSDEDEIEVIEELIGEDYDDDVVYEIVETPISKRVRDSRRLSMLSI